MYVSMLNGAEERKGREGEREVSRKSSGSVKVDEHVLASPTMSWLYSTVTEGTPMTVTGSLTFCCGC